jgi:hypothetical protein
MKVRNHSEDLDIDGNNIKIDKLILRKQVGSCGMASSTSG